MYYVYGFMLLVSIILIIVTTCVTIVGTYFLLNAENYHWQWTAFLSGASTAGTLSLALSLSLSLPHALEEARSHGSPLEEHAVISAQRRLQLSLHLLQPGADRCWTAVCGGQAMCTCTASTSSRSRRR